MAHGRFVNVLSFLRRGLTPAAGELSDRQLLQRFAQKRDEDAFAVLVRRHGPMVLSACRRVLSDVHEAEDAFQATFVVLARKAGDSGWQESVVSWLYEVAFRCASKAKASAIARRRREQQVPEMTPVQPTADVDRRELRALLDEELTRLPEKYRAPVVLCYLEGKSNEEAARLLGWPVGTVYGRLSRARDLLRSRLAGRNLVLPAAALATVLAKSAAPAALPAALFDATVKAATLPASESLAAPVASIVEGVLHTMFVTKLKIAAVLLLVVGLLGAGVGIYHTSGVRGAPAAVVPPPETETAVEKEKAIDPSKVQSKPVRVNGADFEVVADKFWKVPGEGKEQPVAIGLRITNTSEHELVFDDSLVVQLSTADGKEVKSVLAGARFLREPATVRIAAGKSVLVPVPVLAQLQWDAKGTRLTLKTHSSDASYWLMEGLRPGEQYSLKLRYEQTSQAKDRWTGKVETEAVHLVLMTEAMQKISEALRELAAGKGDPKLLTVTYGDLHPLHGGLVLTIHGDGKVEQKAVRVEAPATRDLTAEEVRKLAALLIKQAAWEQRVPERPAVPDESKAGLTLTYGDHTVGIWEWYNDLGKNQRISTISDGMKNWAAKAEVK